VIDLSKGLTMRAQMGTPRKTLLRHVDEAADLGGPSASGNQARAERQRPKSPYGSGLTSASVGQEHAQGRYPSTNSKGTDAWCEHAIRICLR